MAVGAKPGARSDEDWSAIYDAETLMRAEVIKVDSTRLKNAVAWAKELSKEEQVEASAMKTVANLDS